MIRCGANRFNAKHFHHSDEEVRHELGPLVRQDPVRGPGGGRPRVDDGWRHECGRNSSQGNAIGELGKAVGDNQDEAIALLGGRYGTKDVDEKFREALRSWEQRHGRGVSPQGEAVLSTSCAPGDGGVGVRYHQRPVICLSHGVIHPVHTRMGCHCGVVLEPREAFA